MSSKISSRLFNDIYRGRRVFITGHTGFKGSWLMAWLEQLGAITAGYSRAPNTSPSHFDTLTHSGTSIIADVTDDIRISREMAAFKPDIVFHLAAQPLVRYSYAHPAETYATNVQGTLNMLEACRNTPSVKAVVAITTDKVYQNNEWEWPYRENDRLGGYDPYSSSKACAEICIASYRNSFFNLNEYKHSHHLLLASVRAGNVIGGGDWSADRLVPDMMKACAANQTVTIRSPRATRPWQHVLDCLSGYLLTGMRLLEGDQTIATSFNFGPAEDSVLMVQQVVERIKSIWPDMSYSIEESEKNPHEARLLMLDCSRARAMLNWHPVWGVDKAFKHTVDWYRNYYQHKKCDTPSDITHYCAEAAAQGAVWTK